MIQFFLILSYFILTGFCVAGLWKYRQASPVFWFPASLCLMAVGTFAMTNPSEAADRVYVEMFFVAQISFFIGAVLFLSWSKVEPEFHRFAARETEANVPEERQVTVAIFVLSVLITWAYYYAVGYNLLFMVLSGGVAGTDYSELRLAMYSGDEYFAPGYVNQFKNVLLPLSAVSIAMWLKDSRHQVLFYLFSAFAVGFLLYALLGTGQRAYLLYAFTALLFGFVLHNIGKPNRGNLRRVLMALVPVLLLFGFMTGAYKNLNEGGSSITATVIERFTSVQQEGALLGFRYIYGFETAWFAEWGDSLRGLLPYEEGSRLAHEIHELLYGSNRGTVPLSSVGSAYYNGGVLGVILLFSCLGLVYAHLYRRFLTGRRTILRSLTYGSLFFYLAIYVTDTPVGLLENGILTLILFLLLSKIRIGSPAAAFLSLRRRSTNLGN
jgi:oligosaccharide repeat unit polymerase